MQEIAQHDLGELPLTGKAGRILPERAPKICPFYSIIDAFTQGSIG